jgi:1-acyl-sn-glycerol-3-phosphate acyltransferase
VHLDQPLTKLGVPKLWGEEAERLWPIARLLAIPPILAMTRGAGYGLERVPRVGGAVVAANHFSGIDHPLIAIFCPRPVYFLAKAEVLEVPLVGEFLGWIGVFPIRRGEADREALRAARDLVADGKLVGVHLEGTRQSFGHPAGSVHPGGLMIALQEGAPVIPCAVDTFGWAPFNYRPCAVVWGEPMDLNHLPRNRAGYAEAAEIVQAEIVRLWRLAAEAAAARLPSELSDGTRRGQAVLRQPGVDGVTPSA